MYQAAFLSTKFTPQQVALHAEQVLAMFETHRSVITECPHLCFPCAFGLSNCSHGTFEQLCCNLCRSFVGIDSTIPQGTCPCTILGPREAVKRTWLALEAGGYLGA